MKTLLFKVYDTRSDTFRYGGNAVPVDHTTVDNIEKTPFYLELSFFTGTKDINGKQIFGGDVVKYKKDDFGGIAKVTYYDILGAWGLFTKSRVFLHECHFLEVLGFHREPKMQELLNSIYDGTHSQGSFVADEDFDKDLKRWQTS